MSIIEKALRKNRVAGAAGKSDPGAGSSRGASPWAPEIPPDPAPEIPPDPDPDLPAEIQELRPEVLQRHGLILPGEERSGLAEQFRLIKRPLLANAFGAPQLRVRNGNLIMVTSSLPGEGKTFSTINLALSIAMELGRTVLLVDADVAHPQIPKYLELDGDHGGLTDLLTDPGVSMRDVLIRTNIDNLAILPAGKPYRRSTELLASERMSELLDEMARRYSDRVILFDSPPLLAASEPTVLATHMGQVVLVVEAERTPKGALERSLDLVAGCEVVMTILNKAVWLPGMDYANYHYGYGGYGRAAEAPAATARNE